jgi:hypothetical protein
VQRPEGRGDARILFSGGHVDSVSWRRPGAKAPFVAKEIQRPEGRCSLRLAADATMIEQALGARVPENIPPLHSGTTNKKLIHRSVGLMMEG